MTVIIEGRTRTRKTSLLCVGGIAMDDAAGKRRITWGTRDFATNMSAAAAREEYTVLAQLLNRLADVVTIRGLWNEDALKQLYALAGCFLALDRPADTLAAADLLLAKQAVKLQWGEMYESNAHALRAHASALLGDNKTADQSRRRIGQAMPGTPKEITRRWNETVRSYRADAERIQAPGDGIDIIEAAHIQANIVKSLLTAPPEFREKIARVCDDIKTALRHSLVHGVPRSLPLTPPTPPSTLGVPDLPPVFRPAANDPKLVRRYKERIRARSSFKSEPVLHMVIDLAWMLHALGRSAEALEAIEAVLDYHRDNDEFIFNTQEGMQAVKLAALLRKRGQGGPRLEAYTAVLHKLEHITDEVRLRNKRIDRGAPDPRTASRRILEEVVPKGLAQARAESRRVMAFARLRTSLDKVAMALVREFYAGIPAERVHGYLEDGLEQYRRRIEEGV